MALVAKNGTGKTTLLNIIAGREDHDGGEVVPRRDLRIAYLEQSPVYPAEMTVLEACFHSENPALKAIAEYERAIEEPSGEGLQEAMARMDALEAWDYEQRAKRILSRLKIRDFGQRVGTLSGGQLKRVALANVLISESDLLILDDFCMQPLDTQSRGILMDIIEDRHQRRSTMVTSQIPVKDWYDVIGEKTIADAVLDRIVHHSLRVELFGESIRKRKAKSENAYV